MKWNVAVFALGLAVVMISETGCATDWEKDKSRLNRYLDDTLLELKSNDTSLNLDPLHLPDSAFKVRVHSENGTLIIQAKLTNQVLTGLSSLKREHGYVNVVSNKQNTMWSLIRGKDLEISGELSLYPGCDNVQMSLPGGNYNCSCNLCVDITQLQSDVTFGLPENKTEPLTVRKLGFWTSTINVILDKGCIKEEHVKKEFLSKYKEELDEYMDYINKNMEAALAKILKPFEGKQ